MKLIDLLPHKLKEEGNAENIKKILRILQKYIDEDNGKNIDYSNLISIKDVSGHELDLYGDMFYVYRDIGESDDDFRAKIIRYVVLRSTGCTIPAIQGVLDTFLGTGKIKIKENYVGRPANIILVGNNTVDNYDFIFDVVQELVPAGVELFARTTILDTWEDINNGNLWQNVKEDLYVW